MAKKTTTTKTPARKPVSTTAVRNTPVPRTPAAAVAKPVITHDMIAQRAYFIAISGTGGSEFDNWVRAEHELRHELGA